jgi:hypothetical protein
METLKVNDYVKIKENALLNEPLIGSYTDFHGKITEVSEYEGQSLFSVEFDAQSLLNLPNEFIIDAIASLEEYRVYNFFSTDLVKADRRDTDELYAKALEQTMAVEQSYWDNEEDDDEDFDDDDYDDEDEDEDFEDEDFDEDEEIDDEEAYQEDEDFSIEDLEEDFDDEDFDDEDFDDEDFDDEAFDDEAFDDEEDSEFR